MAAIQGEITFHGERPWTVAADRAASRLVASSYHCRKEAAERVFGVLLLIVASPLLVLLAVLVRLTSRGPALFSQERVGKDGRPFLMHKIRTMPLNVEAATGPVWGLPHDPRATRVGRVLRRLHLDELPQLINVVKGDMSLVGPRPERPEFVSVLSAAIPGYLDRITVRPGITGLAQLNLPTDTDLDSVRRKLVLDREYISRGSLWLDFCLVTCTALRVVKLPENLVLSCFGVHRTVTLPAMSDAPMPAKDGDREFRALAAASLALQLKARRRSDAPRRQVVVSEVGHTPSVFSAASKPKPK